MVQSLEQARADLKAKEEVRQQLAERLEESNRARMAAEQDLQGARATVEAEKSLVLDLAASAEQVKNLQAELEALRQKLAHAEEQARAAELSRAAAATQPPAATLPPAASGAIDAASPFDVAAKRRRETSPATTGSRFDDDAKPGARKNEVSVFDLFSRTARRGTAVDKAEATEPSPPRVPPPSVAAGVPEPSIPATVPASTGSSTAPSGPGVLDVLDSDPKLHAGARATIRMVYMKYASRAQKWPGAVPPNLTFLEALEIDPHLNRGQRETIRTMYETYVPGKKRTVQEET